MTKPNAANPPYKLPPPLFDARCKACWFSAGLVVLVVASFWSLDLQWAQFLSLEAARSMGRFVGEFFPPDLSPGFVRRVAVGAWETLAMSLLGTVLAAAATSTVATCDSASDSRHVEMVEIKLAEGEPKHADWRVDNAFPRKGRNQ